jgi:hypothetical protein
MILLSRYQTCYCSCYTTNNLYHNFNDNCFFIQVKNHNTLHLFNLHTYCTVQSQLLQIYICLIHCLITCVIDILMTKIDIICNFKFINPNPHCFIAITKATACGGKKPLLPHPLLSPVGGRGKEVLGRQP